MKELGEEDVVIRGEEERVMEENLTPSSLSLPSDASIRVEVSVVPDVDLK